MKINDIDLKKIRFIDPLKDLGSLLLGVEKPARYIGGEYGRLSRKEYAEKGAVLKTLIAFPDIYEIGMSNQALRIIYNRLNSLDGICCDRAFAPAPDFEGLLKKLKIPLYGLDTGISLKDIDVLMFTLGYELLITGVLTMMDISGIPIRSADRGPDDPIVIMGGPCVSNPLPYSLFIDAFWIGEAEDGFFELTGELGDIKKSGGGREELLSKLKEHPSVWTSGKGRVIRAVDLDFSNRAARAAVFPVPSMKVVHHHGSVEIMRGCPNGCRFCHAGYWYRPMRQKKTCIVEEESAAFIKIGGYREITLSSLSSGDYNNLENLIENLNGKFSRQFVSFQLPSLKVSSFSLNLLEKISLVRKSGLTFAVETPQEFWQLVINKRVSEEDVVSILREAKRRGWRGAKFYFMIGLPIQGLSEKIPGTAGFKPEEEQIVDFIESVARQTGMHFNVNVGTFVPKPHTPFQWVRQISRQEAEEKMLLIKGRLKTRGHKVGVQDSLLSTIEGIASRGDSRAGEFFEEAYLKGCRLDCHREYIKREVWEELLEKYGDIKEEFFSKRESETALPWSGVDSGISGEYFKKEFGRALDGETTCACANNCTNPCGVCRNSVKNVQNIIQANKVHDEMLCKSPKKHKADPDTFKTVFSFSKQGTAVFHPHLCLVEIFGMAFIRASIPVLYTLGFNPLPRLEIASPLSLGIRASGEIAAIETDGYLAPEEFKDPINASLPDGLRVTRVMNVFIPSGSKKHSLSSFLWGYLYAGKDGKPETVKAKDEKAYRNMWIGQSGNLYEMERLSVLARLDGATGASYFDVFRGLYPDSVEINGTPS